MTDSDHESVRQVGFGLSYSISQTRPMVSVAFGRYAVLAALALCIVKVGFGLAGLV
jgi:hypothetical protein